MSIDETLWTLKFPKEGDAPFHRAVVIVTEHSVKGTSQSGQEYVSPLLALTGEEYVRLKFDELHERICDALRGNRPPVIAEILQPDGSHKVIGADEEPPDEFAESNPDSAPS